MSEQQHDATEPKPTTEIAKRPSKPGVLASVQRTDSGLVLTTFDEAYQVSNAIVKSGMAPKGYDTAEQVFAAIQFGAELGLKPMQSLNSIAVVNGRPTVWGDGLMAILHGSGLLEDMQERLDGTADRQVAICRMKRRGIETWFESRFSVEDAKRAKLWMKTGRTGGETPWVTYPQRMLMWRARAYCARDGFADVLRGIQFREEVQDYEPTRTPQARPTALLTADGRIESAEPATPQEAAGDVVDAVAEPLVNAAGELF